MLRISWPVIVLNLVFFNHLPESVAVQIDFESVPLTEGDLVTNELPGLVFSGAVLATPGTPRIAFGTALGSDMANPGEDFTGNFITDVPRPGSGDPAFTPGVIWIDFLTPVSGLSFRIADIDTQIAMEQADITAFDNSGLELESQLIVPGDPGTGDGVATLVAFSSSSVSRVSVDTTQSSAIGWGIDNIRYTPVPEPVCDFTGDLLCTVADIDLMQSLGPIAPGVPAAGNEEFDLDGDGTINLADRDEWLDIAATENGLGSPYKLGDANLDGTVDGQDFIAWNAAKFTDSLLWSDGNFNADGFVDGQDFIAWNANKFTSSDGVTAVPEPGPIAWLVGLFSIVCCRNDSRHRPTKC